MTGSKEPKHTGSEHRQTTDTDQEQRPEHSGGMPTEVLEVAPQEAAAQVQNAAAGTSLNGSPGTVSTIAATGRASWWQGFLHGWRLSRRLKDVGHFHRRLGAHIIDALVLLVLGTTLFFGTVHSPYRRSGDLVLLEPFGNIPVLGRLQFVWDYSTRREADSSFWDLFPYRASSAAEDPPPTPFTYRWRLPGGDEHRLSYTPNGTLWLVVLSLAYFALATGFRGQTLGKWLMGLRVVRSDGRRLGYIGALARALLYLVSATLQIGILWILVDRQYRGWHDGLARTRVVDA